MGNGVKVEIVVEASDSEPVRAAGEMRVLGPGARVVRAAAILLLAVGLSAALIPVPVVHLVGIPLMLIAGVAAAVRQLRSVALLDPVRFPCPRCGARNSIGGGLGLATSTGPIQRDCESCRRQLQITFQSA